MSFGILGGKGGVFGKGVGLDGVSDGLLLIRVERARAVSCLSRHCVDSGEEEEMGGVFFVWIWRRRDATLISYLTNRADTLVRADISTPSNKQHCMRTEHVRLKATVAGSRVAFDTHTRTLTRNALQH